MSNVPLPVGTVFKLFYFASVGFMYQQSGMAHATCPYVL